MFNEQTESAIRQRMLDKIDLDLYKGEGSDLYQLVTPLAMELASFYAWLDYFKEVIFGRKLDENFVLRAEAFGVFRKLGEKAAGELTLTSSGAVNITKGTRLVSKTGLFYELKNDLSFDKAATLTVSCEAESVGVEYNVEADSLSFVTDIPLITSITHSNFTNGIDMETLEQLQDRFFEKLRNPSSSGNIADYERWAKSIDGVVQVKVYKLAMGEGTVKIVASGEKGKALQKNVFEELKATISELAPIGCMPYVFSTEDKDIVLQITGLEVDDSKDRKNIETSIMESIQAYFEEVEPNSTIYVNKIIGVIMSVDGVNDVESILIDGNDSNVKLSQVEKGVLTGIQYV